MAILMHEAAHRTLFRSRRWNDRCANWLGVRGKGGLEARSQRQTQVISIGDE